MKKQARKLRPQRAASGKAGAAFCRGPATCAPAAERGAYVREKALSIALGNQQVELTVDRQTGYFLDIHNKTTGLHHKLDESGSWPFRLRLGTATTPYLLRVEMTAKPKYPQKMAYQVKTGPGGKVLQLQYDNLVTTGGTLTGVRLEVELTLKHGADYFLIRARLANRGRHGITRLESGGGDLVAAANPEQETLAIPCWGYGTLWPKPRASFAAPETIGYPIMGGQCCVEAGWLDLYGKQGGIGIGYLNRQMLSMYFQIWSRKRGLDLAWRLFDLAAPDAESGGVFPLRPGREFTTDQWILAPHAGDWHRMADIYRAEYERAFQGDYLTWEATDPRAKNLDCFVFVNQPGLKFAAVPAAAAKMAARVGINPENLFLMLWGHSRNFPKYMPDHLPLSAQAGGEAGFKKMMAGLNALGLGGLFLYAHLFYNHPKALDYVAEADTGRDDQNAIWNEIGNIACVDCAAWQQIWKRKYWPGYRDLGAAGVTLDQGPTQYLVCPTDGHRHGRDSLKKLSAHCRGITELIRSLKATFAQGCMVYTECGSDLQTRHADLWSCGMTYMRGGVQTREIMRYTFPRRLCVAMEPKTAEDVNYALVNGFSLHASMGLDPSQIFQSPDELLPALRQYFALRRELRNSAAPGYPQGFKDQVGLAAGSPQLVARAFREARGITVLYYAREALKTTIAVDKSALGFAGRETIPVKLEAGQAGYRILATE